MTHPTMTRTIVLSLLLGILAASITSCSQSPQEKYNHAQKQLQQAQKNRDQARKNVDETRKELAKRQNKLDAAENKLQDAQQNVQQASKAVDKTVNDALLFRTLQGKLVNKDDFGTSAISVSVHNRVVTLTGTVPDKQTHQRALKITRSQAGVDRVIDQLQIAPPAKNQSSGTSGSGTR